MPNAIDVVAEQSFRAVAFWDDGGMANQQMIEALLGVGYDHVARTQQMLPAILARVILDALVLIAASLVNRVEIVHRQAGAVITQALSVVAEAAVSGDVFIKPLNLPTFGNLANRGILEMPATCAHRVEVHEPTLK